MMIKRSDAGKLVTLPIKPDWGPGKIVKIEAGYAYIRFRDCEDRMAKKYSVTENPLALSQVQTDAVLDDLIQQSEKKKRVRKPAEPIRRITFQEAVALFKAKYPQAFGDALYKGGAKVGGQYAIEDLARTFHSSFGDGQLRKMVDNHSARVIADRALALLDRQDLIYRGELKSFKNLLKDEAQTLAYFRALAFALEAGAVTETSMRPYFEAVNACPIPGFAKWPNATLFLFLARPECHMLLKPQVTKRFAAMLGNALIYEAHPNWMTYVNLLEMSAGTLGMLKPLGARDYLDLLTFMQVVQETASQKEAAGLN